MGLSVLFVLFVLGGHGVGGADLVIRIPGDLSQQDGYYRLDYRPPAGSPAANTTAPDPPTNLEIDVQSGEKAVVSWEPPLIGRHSGFKLKVIPLSEPLETTRSLLIRETKSTLRDLSAGATYKIQLYTVYENKESQDYISTNFTTKPNTPGRFIVWYRNETTLLVLWQPPYPAGFYTDYKVSIDPEDTLGSVLYVAKEGEPPGPARAVFNGLVPGRAYNISVETVSEGQISDPTTAQYRTVPLRPHNVTFDADSIRPDSFYAGTNLEPIYDNQLIYFSPT